MTALADGLLLLVLVTDLYILASARLAACVRATAVQGVFLAALPLVLWGPGGTVPLVHLALMSVGALAVKAVVIPALLLVFALVLLTFGSPKLLGGRGPRTAPAERTLEKTWR